MDDNGVAAEPESPGARSGRPSYYVTTPIYYPSGRLHVGHAYTTVAADFLARYKRMCGYDARMLTGTDEHSQKIVRAARQEGLTPEEYADRAYDEIVRLWDVLDISYDDFIRTTEPRHKFAVEEIFSAVHRRGDIYKGAYEGWYCAECESFFLERQLIDGRCPDCGRAVEWLAEEAYFFRLSRYQDRLLEYIKTHPEFVQPVSRRNEMLSFIRSGLQDLCVTRSAFAWGIEVPFDPQHVIYVWFDALSNYITALNYGRNDGMFERYWPADVHLVGKEIVRFHTVIWPILLMSLGLPLPRRVFGHGWLVVEGEKMSKSKGNVIDPAVLVEKYGVDAVRYFLLREVPFGADGIYSEDALVRRTNTDLANDLGNLLSRTLAMVERFAGGKVPVPDASIEDRPLRKAAARAFSDYTTRLEKLELADALASVFELVNAANKYIEDMSPWEIAKDPSRSGELGTVLYDLLETLRLVAVLLSPALTRAPERMLRQIGFPDGPLPALLPEAAGFGLLPPGRRIRRDGPLFPRIDDRTSPQKPVESAVREPEVPRAAGGTTRSAEAPGAGGKISIDEFAAADLRVARVIQAENVPGTSRLLRLLIRIGDEERQIIAGIAAKYRPEEVAGRDVVVVANLKSATIRGQRSEGMLLAAVEGDRLALVVPDRDVPSGAKVR